MYHIQLVFNAAGIMGRPVILNLAIDKGIIDITVKKRQFPGLFFRLPIPQINDAVAFPDHVSLDIKPA
jgi:hypothetical protein